MTAPTPNDKACSTAHDAGRRTAPLVAAAVLAATLYLLQPAGPPRNDSRTPAKGDSETAAPDTKRSAPPAAPVEAAKPASEWVSLFDGASLAGWKPTEFGGEGEVRVQEGSLILEMGNDLTGVTATREVPKINYEVELEAMRVDGSDFFCGLTFPVRDSSCSLIVGGWGGGVCGLSSLDSFDASENETTSYREFETGRWYPVRVKVTEPKIEAWLDGEKIVDIETAGRRINVRIEVEASRPFGLASWRTTAALRNIRLRPLPAAAASAATTP